MAVGLVAVTAVATWCLIGPLDETAEPGRELDHVVEVPDPPRWAELVVAVVAIALAGLLGRALVRAAGPTLRPRALGALALAAAAGLVLGGAGRLLTAGSVGANIGGGIALLFGLPTAVVLAGVAIVLAPPPPPPPPTDG